MVILPRSRLCAAHVSNHLMVQELLLHAALSRNDFSLDDRQSYLTLAKHIAQLPYACVQRITSQHLRRGSAQTPRPHSAACHVAYERIWHQRDQQTGGQKNISCGERKVPVFYDDAVRHQHHLQELLGPHGYRVALVGKMRCGCPVSPRAMLLLTRGDQDDCGGVVARQNDDGDSDSQILFERALRGLVVTGYLRSFSRRKARGFGEVMVRYVCLARVPRQCGPESLLFSGESLQELVLVWSPPRAFHVRCLFLTGPNPFLAHLMLLANAKGYELLYDGLYRRLQDTREIVALRSEKDIFTVLWLPYVDPLYRYAYCRLQNLL